MFKFIKNIILVTLLLTISYNSCKVLDARWLTKKDAEIEYEYYEENIKIKNDGSNDRIIKYTIKLLKEGARNLLSKYNIIYNDSFEEVNVLNANTIHKNKKYKVIKNLIEKKPLASEAQGFDQKYQISIPFKKVEVGSKIDLELSWKQKKTPIKNHYSELIEFGQEGYWNNAKVLITSEIPLNMKINDPYKVLKITQKNKKNIEILLIKSFTNEFISDVQGGILDFKYKTWVSISSSDNWNFIGESIERKYREIINQKLPEKFKKIAKLASKEKSEIDKINKVTSLVQDNIQYLGDWKTIEGRYYPRNLNTIESTQYGDCKDFSVVVATILNSIGFNANIALVNRGEIKEEYKGLPSVSAFNHAITYVKDKTGGEYWIDPTNVVSMADGIFPDISDRMALVLKVGKNIYKKIKKINYKKAISVKKVDVLIKNDFLNKNVKVLVSGEKAFHFNAIGLFLSKKMIEDNFLKMIEDGQLIDIKNRKKSIIPDLKSRIVKDVAFQFEYEQDNQFIKTNYGRSLKLSSVGVPDFLRDVPYDSVKDFYIGYPNTLFRTIKINYALKNVKSLNFNIFSPWINVSRVCEIKDNNTIIEDKIEIIRSFITAEERKEKKYRDLRRNIEKHYNKVILVLA